MPLPAFELHRPRSLDEAAACLAAMPSARLLAGGTDLIPAMQQGLCAPSQVVDLTSARDLAGLDFFPDGGARLGAGVRLSALEFHPELARRFPLLAQAAAAVASPLQRALGTLGGNLCLDTRCRWYNQSWSWRRACGFCLKKDGARCHVAPGGERCWAAYSGDLAPALLAMGADLELAAPGGVRRRLPLPAFFTGDGARPFQLQPGELVAAAWLPGSSAGWRGAYRKFRVRASIDYPLAGLALALDLEGPRIRRGRAALTAVNPSPRLVAGAETLLAGADPRDPQLADALARLVRQTAKPLSTSSFSPAYRRDILALYARRALLDLSAPGCSFNAGICNS